jgi:protein O-GlcNAc transferase
MNHQIQLMLQQAIQAFQAANFDEADSILKRILQVDSKNFPSLHILGLIKASQFKFREATDYLARAARIQPNDASLQYNLAKALSDSGNDTDALSHHKKAVALAPNNPEAWLNYGKTTSNLGRYDEALAHYDKSLSLKPDYAEAWSNKGVALIELKRYDEALAHYDKALSLKPDYAEAWSNKGATLNDLKRFDEALAHFDEALSLKSDYAEAWSNKGVTLNGLKRHDEALAHYDKSLSLKPDYAEAWSNKGVALIELQRYDEALAHYDKPLSLKPDYAEAWSNKGVVLIELKRFDEALAHYDKSLSLKPDYAEAWSNKGVVLIELQRFDEALAHYDKALSLKPDYAEAWSNKGVTLNGLKRFDEALAHYDKALSLKPDYAEAWSNKGVTLNGLKQHDEALAHFDKALSLKPDYAEAWSNKGATLNDLKRFDEALAHYDKALSLKPDIDWIYGDLIHAKMRICEWSSFPDALEMISKKLTANEKVVNPFVLLSLNDDALMHKKSSEIYAYDRYRSISALVTIPKSANKDKIRIAYFSPDFRNHPVSFLTSELFEIHNRNRFEVFAFSLHQAAVRDEMNLRLRKGFDKFFDVGNMSDKEIAQFARECEIDIAIDLAGPTQYSRTGIFSYRAAPIQINWLGYPGTIGADFIDYIVADRTIIPETHYKFYVEKVVCLPDTYMVDDSKRVASSRRFTREECGLPKNAFVFCCFNNEYKFNSQVLDGWSRILLRAENSVLWIPENNQSFKTNVTTEFEKRGLDRSRLIFAKRLESMADHLARYDVADLFLDTHPYNAHTTAVDSLKSGVPVLTLMGQSFASRVAASLLSAIDLPELITSTQEEYEALAIELALNPKKLADIKFKLDANRLTTPLFNTPLFTKNIEAAYIKMMERYWADLQPEHIFII